MKILIVEDSPEFCEELHLNIQEISKGAHISVASHRDAAIEQIEDQVFDLIILDLNIPPDGNVGLGNPSHGHSVFTETRTKASGTPIIVLTGSSAEDFIPSLLKHQRQGDVWGQGDVQLVAFHRKHQLDTFPDLLKTYIDQIAEVEEIEITKPKDRISEQEDRLFRIFTKKAKGARCVVAQVGGGLSATAVYRLTARGSNGDLIYNAIAKIGLPESVRDEDQRYSQHVARLAPETTPRKIAILEHGAKDFSGVFYSLAAGFDSHAWSEQQMSQNSESLVRHLQEYLRPWESQGEQRLEIKQIRRLFISDENFSQVKLQFPCDWWDAFEAKSIQVRWGCCHGDLHGLNVLCTSDGKPILIDYGDVQPGPSSVDPITLELSGFFHPEGPLVDSAWPSAEQAHLWGTLDAYLENCPCADFVRRLRTWSQRVAIGNREIAAVSYSYLVRQLKYPNTNKQRALDLLEGVRKFYDVQS